MYILASYIEYNLSCQVKLSANGIITFVIKTREYTLLDGK